MLKLPASDIAISTHAEVNRTEFIKSRYDFLKVHKGIRPNTLHGMMSNTGVGKTTLLKSVICEAAVNIKVLIWLSEETVLEYQSLLNDIDKSVVNNMVFVEEKKIPEEHKVSQPIFFAYFERMIEESGCRLVFIDNITTSAFYNSRFGFTGQNKTAEFLSTFVKRVCSVFYICHTVKDITDNYNKIVNPEDIRGSKELALLTEYFYIIQKFTSSGKIYNILRNAKHRHHREAAGFFSLVFEKGYYVGDSKIPFDMVNYIFKSRDYLGKKTAKNIEKPPVDKLSGDAPTPEGAFL